MVVTGSDPQLRLVARYFTDLVQRTSGIALQVEPRASDSEPRITFALDSNLPHPEGYSIDISPERVSIRGGGPSGLFYGAVTFWQLLTPTDGANSVRVPSMRISDAPRFAWRGLMLDVARHYMPPDFIKQMIDWMALHKLNTFHWHLTDDQGWRIEIKKYPKLTDTGAWRVPAGGHGVDASGRPQRYGGFYTQDEIRDIVRYASERYITVVPEIELPGHAQAAIAAYPELGTGDRPAVSPDWGIHTYVFNVEERTFTFLEDVLSEVVALFPGQYIHVGGDEAVKDRWRSSARVQQRMRELGVANEAALQSYFVARIGRFLSARGRKLIGWDEILEGGLPPGATVMSWRGTQGAIEAARKGHDVVMAPAPDLYMDYLQSDSPDEPSGRPRLVTLESVYGFEPVPREISAKQAHHVLGAQVNLWTEHMRTPERIQHNAFPRVAALAEITWSPVSQRDWASFLARLPAQLERYRLLGIGYADTALQPRLATSYDRANTRLRVELSNQVRAGEIRYTLDASEPTAQSALYRAPLELTLPVELRAATFMQGRRVSDTRSYKLDKLALLRRSDDELRFSQNKIPLRLEDDAPAQGERAVFNVDILEPSWVWEQADLTGIRGITASVGQVPFNFQLGADKVEVPLHKPETAHGELEVRIDSCEGERVAFLPLAPAIANAGITTLPRATFIPREGRHDLCFRFTRRAVDPIWVIDWVQLLD